MNKILKNHIISLLMVVGTASWAQTIGPTINYVEILPADSKEEIIKNAANVTPSRYQLA